MCLLNKIDNPNIQNVNKSLFSPICWNLLSHKILDVNKDVYSISFGPDIFCSVTLSDDINCIYKTSGKIVSIQFDKIVGHKLISHGKNHFCI